VTTESPDPDQAAVASGGDAEQFGRWLSECGRDYCVVQQRDDQHARVRFCGPFQGTTVVWDCEFMTLAFESARRKGSDASAGPPRNFIEIGPPGAKGVPLRVGLRLPRIDIPAIEKMIIMIRNYKRLRPGRHEYGEPRTGLNPEA
jgi:hypothetical protein